MPNSPPLRGKLFLLVFGLSYATFFAIKKTMDYFGVDKGGYQRVGKNVIFHPSVRNRVSGSEVPIKAIAIGGKSRSALLPQVPTFAELGYPEVETHAWFGLFLPAGSPKEAVSRIYSDVKRILEEPDFRQKQLVERGYEVVGSSPDEFVSYMKTDSESRRRAVKISGARAE